MSLRQAAQQALEALEVKQHILRQAVRLICEMSKQPLPQGIDDDSDAITALKQALAEPEQNQFGDDAERYALKLHEERESCKAIFTAPTPQPEQKSWFTVEELNEFATKLKEKAWKA